jgi:uncharacterized protein YajQ (UPF0234 family)
MASTFSFDIVSDFDRQELVNAIDTTKRDVQSRYDLKDTKTEIELGADSIVINTDSEFTLDAVHTLMQQRAAKRNLSLKIFDYGKVESASGNRVRQEIKLKKGRVNRSVTVAHRSAIFLRLEPHRCGRLRHDRGRFDRVGRSVERFRLRFARR